MAAPNLEARPRPVAVTRASKSIARGVATRVESKVARTPGKTLSNVELMRVDPAIPATTHRQAAALRV
jgi:hypothetical protein